MMCSVEEMNLMCIFDHSGRGELMEDISASIPYIDDVDMLSLMEQTVTLLSGMSEDEFAELVFEPALDEDEESWGEEA